LFHALLHKTQTHFQTTFGVLYLVFGLPCGSVVVEIISQRDRQMDRKMNSQDHVYYALSRADYVVKLKGLERPEAVQKFVKSLFQ